MPNYNEIIEKKENLKKKIIKYKNKIFKLEHEIINIDNELANFSDNIILDNLQLNKQQNDIINGTENNILVIACPGSGKTHTLISKYIKLIVTNEYKPEEIILITFTKKAGNEILNRLSKSVPNKLPYYVGTIHGLSYKILQEYNNINYIILDDIETKNYIINIINNYNFEDLSNNDIDILKEKIPIIIDQTSNIYPYNLKLIIKKNNLENYYKEINLIIKKYNENKKKENIIDFNDLMILFNNFLKDNKKSKIFKNKIKYIFFDEYQDINSIQNNILLKFSEYSKLILVGDDAQSIYSFRGSSINYILNFEKYFNNNKIYLLEENYRSTPLIVNFCENIIKNNTNQINKNIISKQDKLGIKPSIYNFNSKNEQYEWVVNDIINKVNKGIKLSDIVILARKNYLLDDIELNLLNNKIPTIKHLGLSILDKSHIKDFLAFIIILINNKSTIHWKRIISIHPNYNIQKANNIVDNSINILETIKLDNNLINLYNLINNIKNIKNNFDKTKNILNYIENLWIINKENNITSKKLDIINLLKYIKDYSLEDFINNLYLNLEVETDYENILYLTTIHGSKGLEWEHVYIIDMTCKDFPSIKSKYFLDELEDMEEERRLFYVATSRAKKFLTITYYENNENKISPFIKELDLNLYNSCGVFIDYNINNTFNICKDINNYLLYNGYSKITNIFKNLNNIKTKLNLKLDIPKHLNNTYNKKVIDTFINLLIYKIIQVNYNNFIDKFEFTKIKCLKISNKVYLEYIDNKIDWKNILEHIFLISVTKNNCYNYNNIKNFLINDIIIDYYLNLEKEICKLISSSKINSIKFNHYISSNDKLYSDINILSNNTIIDIISNTNEICTINNIYKQLLNVYILKEKNIIINNIIIFNPVLGDINKICLNNFDLNYIKSIIY